MSTENNSGGLIFGVDIDGVLADLHTPFTAFVSERVGRELPYPSQWDMSEQWGMTSDELLGWFREFTIERRYRDLPVIEGAADTLWRLHEAGVHIRIITHRLFIPDLHDIFVADTGHWLQKSNIPFWDVCIMGKGGRKYDVGADIYIDDSPHVIEALRENRKAVLIYNRVYNQGYPGVPRVHNWAEVGEFFSNMYGLEVPEEIPPRVLTSHG